MPTMGDVLSHPETELAHLEFHGQLTRGNRKNPSRGTVVIPEHWIDDLFQRSLGGEYTHYYFLVRVPRKHADKLREEGEKQKKG